jgi:hypothetical protein
MLLHCISAPKIIYVSAWLSVARLAFFIPYLFQHCFKLILSPVGLGFYVTIVGIMQFLVASLNFLLVLQQSID